MPADQIGATGAGIAVGTSAGTVELTSLVREVRVTNAHATQYVDIAVAEGTFAGNPATTAVVAADNLVRVPANTTRTVWKNPRVKKAINLSLIASGATTPVYVEGSLWLT